MQAGVAGSTASLSQCASAPGRGRLAPPSFPRTVMSSHPGPGRERAERAGGRTGRPTTMGGSTEAAPFRSADPGTTGPDRADILEAGELPLPTAISARPRSHGGAPGAASASIPILYCLWPPSAAVLPSHCGSGMTLLSDDPALSPGPSSDAPWLLSTRAGLVVRDRPRPPGNSAPGRPTPTPAYPRPLLGLPRAGSGRAAAAREA